MKIIITITIEYWGRSIKEALNIVSYPYRKSNCDYLNLHNVFERISLFVFWDLQVRGKAGWRLKWVFFQFSNCEFLSRWRRFVHGSVCDYNSIITILRMWLLTGVSDHLAVNLIFFFFLSACLSLSFYDTSRDELKLDHRGWTGKRISRAYQLSHSLSLLYLLDSIRLRSRYWTCYRI